MTSVERFGGREALQFLEQFVHSSRHTGRETIRVDLAQHHDGSFGLSIGGRTFTVNPPSTNRAPVTPERLQAEFKPRPSFPRWLDEQAIFPYTSPDQLTRVSHHLVNRLLPEARVRCKEEAEKRKAREEEERKKKEQEEAEAAAAAAAKAEAEAQAQPEPSSDDHDIVDSDDVEMGKLLQLWRS